MSSATPWVIVSGGLHQRGGMDRANAALAAHLLDRGTPLHLVAHDIDPGLARHPLVVAHHVTRPKGMPAMADRLLARTGLRVAGEVVARDPEARVVVNGGNCPWPDINWVHAVHAAWPVHDPGTPWWGRLRNRHLKVTARRRELTALSNARAIVANSNATREAILGRAGVSPERVHTVYLGSDPSWGAVDDVERAASKAEFDLAGGGPVVTFVGALGSDINKGFDLLWDAWKLLVASDTWDARLVVAGAGWRLRQWQEEALRAGRASSVRFLGFTPRVRELLAATDLLVSPVRYEAYGLNVHEALCRGAAVMVSASAGVTERFDAAMIDALLPRDLTSEELARRLRLWREDVEGWRARAATTAARLRARSWRDMAADLVAIAEGTRELVPA